MPQNHNNKSPEETKQQLLKISPSISEAFQLKDGNWVIEGLTWMQLHCQARTFL